MGLQRFKLNIANSVVNEDNASLKSMVCFSPPTLLPSAAVSIHAHAPIFLDFSQLSLFFTTDLSFHKCQCHISCLLHVFPVHTSFLRIPHNC
jgi:hypothetical protein